MDLVLVHPEIPHNTGCAARLSAALGLPLHLVEPLGFRLEDRHLKRAGLDYWPLVDLRIHADWASALGALGEGSPRPVEARLRFFSARGGASLFEASFAADDVLVFGAESVGLPPEICAEGDPRNVYIPIRRAVRSLNLANVVALGAYTAMDRAGLDLPDNDGEYRAHPDAWRDVRPAERVRGKGSPSP